VECSNRLCSIITNGVRRTRDIEYSTDIAKAVINKHEAILNSKLDLSLKKKPVGATVGV
jgi:hypothetical protein